MSFIHLLASSTWSHWHSLAQIFHTCSTRSFGWEESHYCFFATLLYIFLLLPFLTFWLSGFWVQCMVFFNSLCPDWVYMYRYISIGQFWHLTRKDMDSRWVSLCCLLVLCILPHHHLQAGCWRVLQMKGNNSFLLREIASYLGHVFLYAFFHKAILCSVYICKAACKTRCSNMTTQNTFSKTLNQGKCVMFCHVASKFLTEIKKMENLKCSSSENSVLKESPNVWCKCM